MNEDELGTEWGILTKQVLHSRKWEMLLYKEVTSAVTKVVLGGRWVGSDQIILRINFLVYQGRDLTIAKTFSVGEEWKATTGQRVCAKLGIKR